MNNKNNKQIETAAVVITIALALIISNGGIAFAQKDTTTTTSTDNNGKDTKTDTKVGNNGGSGGNGGNGGTGGAKTLTSSSTSGPNSSPDTKVKAATPDEGSNNVITTPQLPTVHTSPRLNNVSPPIVKCKANEVLKEGVCVVKVGTPVEKCPSVKTATTSSSAADCQKLPRSPPVYPQKCGNGKVYLQSVGCINKHPTRHEAWMYGYKMGLTDGDDQENYVGTGGLKGHSSAFTAGYNCAFGGQCPKGFHPPH